jgi:hypothetical protein
MELEFMNIEKAAVELPSGYAWSPDEMWIRNTDGSVGTPSAKRGGEINTRPLYYEGADVAELKTFIRKCYGEYGGVMGWFQTFDIHVDISDVTDVEVLKRFPEACFRLMSCWHGMVDAGAWTITESWSPYFTADERERCANATSMEALQGVFANSSIKGCRRHNININPYWKQGTVEFRSFAATDDWEKIDRSIRLCVNLCEFIIRGGDLCELETEAGVRRVTGVVGDFAKYPAPLIYAAHHSDLTTYRDKAFGPSSSLTRSVKKNLNGPAISCNPFDYKLELSLYGSGMLKSIYSQSAFDLVLARLASGELDIVYYDQLEFLNEYKNGTSVRELTLFFCFHRFHKIDTRVYHGSLEMGAYVGRMEETVEKMDGRSARIIAMVNDVGIEHGTLLDAQADYDGDVVFCQGHAPKKNSTVSSMAKMTNRPCDDENLLFDHLSVDFSKDLFVVSRNEFLDMHVIAKDNVNFLYATRERKPESRIVLGNDKLISFNIPDDDFDLAEAEDVRVMEMSARHFHQMQKTFIKKVAKAKCPRFCFAIVADGYMLGGFGFDYPKDQDYDIYLLCDFCTNNDVRLLSKFVVMAAKTRIVKRMLDRRSSGRFTTCYTNVFTTMHQSMKYRGVAQRNKTKSEKGKKLMYELDLGSQGDMQDAINDYRNRVKK